MSLKRLSLGQCASAAAGITCSDSTNATPIVITLGAGHGLRNGDRIALSGIIGNTNANGEWTLSSVGATTATLNGSVGNGTHGGTPAVAVICDTTPFMKEHSAVAAIHQDAGAVFVGTLLIEGCSDAFPPTTWVDATLNSPGATSDRGGVAIPAATAGQATFRDVRLFKYMRMRCSAYTSGQANGSLMA